MAIVSRTIFGHAVLGLLAGAGVCCGTVSPREMGVRREAPPAMSAIRADQYGESDNTVAGTAFSVARGASPSENAAKETGGPVSRLKECRDGCIEIALEPAENYRFTGSYVEAVVRRIGVNLAFPWRTIERGATGEVAIRIKIDRKGVLVSSQVIKSSGSDLLDESALKSITAAAPFNPFPPAPYVQSMTITAKFHYSI